MKILIISEALPYPLVTGDRIRIFNLLKFLSKYHEIYLTAFLAHSKEKELLIELKKYCVVIETITARRISKLKHLPGVLHCLLSGQPLDTKFVFNKPMIKKIKKLMTQHKFDLIQIEHSFMAKYVKIIPKNYGAKKVLTFHNICSIQYKRMFQIETNFIQKIRYFLNWIPMKRWEPSFAANFDKCVTTSIIDKQILQNANPCLDISVVPNGIDIEGFEPLPKPAENNVMFIGKMNYQPNIDAVLYFYNDIFPIVKDKIPDIKFYIVGLAPHPEVKKLDQDKNVFVTGFVEDIRLYYKKCAVSIVPLRAGGGTRLKILESMALARPVVSTTVGCEGLELKNGRNILIADAPFQFAMHIIKLLTDNQVWHQITKNARKLVEHKYNWNDIGNGLMNIYESMIEKNN